MRTSKIGTLVLGVAALFSVATPLAAKSYPPRNECTADPAANSYHLAFVTAVANRDVAMLQGLMGETVLLGFGGSNGPDTLAEWLASPDIDMWAQLDEMARLGCALGDATDGGHSIIIPWIWSQPVEEVDGIEGFTALGPDVPLRAGPSSDAPVVERLNWHAVQLVSGWGGDSEWREVARPGGPSGYVREDQLRSLIARRLVAEQVDGEYKAAVLVAGD
ncbi:hypothetical protein [Alteriqipengyuania sp.]|uniref:hypothetical protein n=1 Tax=Alteriqipengyuania sp. TaxID=2800692 RepID=UPI0035122761